MAAKSTGSLVVDTGGPVSEEVSTTLDLATLVVDQKDFVYRSLRRSGLDAAAAEDAAQQVFLIASRKLDVITIGKEKAFLYRTARNVAAEYRRRSAKRIEVELIEEEVGNATRSSLSPPDELLDEQRARALLDEVLASMSEPLREVFVLCELEELTAAEVAAYIHIPAGTVASRLARARDEFDVCLVRIQARRAFVRPCHA